MTAPPMFDEITLDDVNIYAAQTYDRYHLNHLDISFRSNPIKSIEADSDSIDQWTVDQDTAFQIGWDLQFIPDLKDLAIKKAKQVCFYCGVTTCIMNDSSISSRDIHSIMIIISIHFI